MSETSAPQLAAKPEGLVAHRVWPDGTVQSTEEGAPYSWMSDDFLVVNAENEEQALLLANL